MRNPQNKKSIFKKFFIPLVLFAVAGSYFVISSQAAENVPSPCVEAGEDANGDPICADLPIIANPLLSAGCGYDIALLGDASDSMRDKVDMLNHMKSLVNALQGTNSQFAVGGIGPIGSMTGFSSDRTTVHANIDSGKFVAGSFRDLRIINQMDRRPDRQNLIILFTDMFNSLENDTSADIVKQSGARIVIMKYSTSLTYGDPKSDEVKFAQLFLAGPTQTIPGNPGSIGSDVLVVGGNSVEAYIAALAAHAKQPCTPWPGPGGPSGSGPVGTGSGNGNGGSGTGANGQGTGQGPGASGGGSSATTQADTANNIPSTSAQGLDSEQPKLEPSPFFDGRTYAPGSDPIDKVLGNLSIGGKRILHGWLYLLGMFFVIGNLLAGYVLWWKRLPVTEQMRLKAKLHLSK